MNRREALKSVAFLMGSAISATTMGVLFESFTLPEKEKNSVSFSAADEEILAEFADIIIPTTASSAGAKAAGLGAFIPMIIRECYPAKMQEIFASGMQEMQAKCVKDFNKNFLSMSVEERQQLMTSLRDEAIATDKAPSFFLIARDLTLLGYYSSEIGCTQAREYLPVPGRYDGSADYKPGQKAWATN
ncbi:gluconate 2-dehydrogenase subunit 3 family protein [Flavobacterium sp. LS1P28]|uniref:Gluconate 2-dehydrogenase subunit 3 family protein n=1 Tax=Flavobacterium bomense TaxID=2497483 RepID=A0A432CQI7_9FLAO|nr:MULTISPECIES: gluconate 2-dehydrogenase subunit 3 family protein [Flavobacterium]RTY69707.1 gluconate 2-dehydrogenase subunit 3 family protein [Flavobacterium sp. LB2P53]RTY82033.1 gluconate 2-dehydrogenase subunit 3 family protein [Flavobacterium sp. LS1P28]RTY88774.1 gluconate 2-dehydrogenase subunit 3 family protein [Flavobacterium sp. RSP15]RTZ03453.1 gluconate 2-dehydrogenase subunit 3 family protein [Flavobacterium sp. RSP49]RTZ05750.1 gluconate 2-dehydrogenase subunit 3 family protei